MKDILLMVIFSVLLHPLFGQNSNRPVDGPYFYFNSFQDYRNKNSDSAIHYIKLLATNTRYNSMLQDLLHNSFAQSFQKMWEKKIKDSTQKMELANRVLLSKDILNRMIGDSTQALVISSIPIYYWTQAQQYENDATKLKEIASAFIKKLLSTDDIHDNRTGRYALLIYQILLGNGNLDNLANKLFTTTLNKLKSNPIMQVGADTLSRQTLAKRSWYRFLYAYCNYILANQQLHKGYTRDAGKYFLTAYEYSPDLFDRNNYSSYFYDMVFLLEKEKNTFQDDYIAYLKLYTRNKQDVLNRLLSLSLSDPTFKKDLKAYYNDNFSKEEPFSTFWYKNINQSLKKAPSFTLVKMNGENFSIEEKPGKWILLDFWGTWCSPCRAEHPDLQKLYKELYEKTQNFELLTIACRDDSSKVKDYMNANSYTFPVAMADNKIESIYHINSYPSKFLITPQGNFLTVPFGIDWVSFIKNYIGL